MCHKNCVKEVDIDVVSIIVDFAEKCSAKTKWVSFILSIYQKKLSELSLPAVITCIIIIHFQWVNNIAFGPTALRRSENIYRNGQ